LLGLTFAQFINRKQSLHKELLSTVWVTSQGKTILLYSLTGKKKLSMNRNREYFTDISYISEKQAKFIKQNDEIPFGKFSARSLSFVVFSNAIYLN